MVNRERQRDDMRVRRFASTSTTCLKMDVLNIKTDDIFKMK